ncbi:putative signal transducing protein [Aestuariibaculum suncheonense]|uniref:DUF2007 domain-containing protein n=1 Tax=Aestuariibaculum suncheonense TaxID=1028745 RepID=A0A8J6QDE4_9FLAO|nr:DUF2007 domain-containing protein [Aestuariibaculum suncheonense]MBD0835023.1 DUF2007 domain-containing protein [Aestuariibaculum suncheonense]
MKNSEYIKIYTGDALMVRRFVLELEDAGINAVVKDQTESARLAGFGGGILPGFQEIFVHQDELEKANKIIDDITSELEA